MSHYAAPAIVFDCTVSVELAGGMNFYAAINAYYFFNHFINKVMGDHKNCHSLFQPVQYLMQVSFLFGINVGCRLIQNQKFWIGR